VNRIGLQRATALLLAGALLLAAAPAFAAPPKRGAGEARVTPPLVDALSAWLAAFWTGAAPGGTPAAARLPLGSEGDPAVEPAAGSEGGTNGEPTAQPQLGVEGDPDG
jgi:hypothetical protein